MPSEVSAPGLDIQPFGPANHFLAPFDGACNLPEFNQPAATPPARLPIDRLDQAQRQVDTVFALPLFGGFALSLLAVIAAILQFVQVKMTSPRPNPDDATSGMTSTMTYTFPLLTIVWGGIFPSGLILYWIVYTSYLVVQQYLIMGWGNLFPIVGWQPSWAHTANGTDTRSSRSSRLATDEPLAEAPPAAVSSGASASGATAAGRRPTSRDRSGSKRRHRRG